MSYKRVKGDFNEVIFATFLPEHGKGKPLLADLSQITRH